MRQQRRNVLKAGESFLPGLATSDAVVEPGCGGSREAIVGVLSGRIAFLRFPRFFFGSSPVRSGGATPSGFCRGGGNLAVRSSAPIYRFRAPENQLLSSKTSKVSFSDVCQISAKIDRTTTAQILQSRTRPKQQQQQRQQQTTTTTTGATTTTTTVGPR